MNQSGLQLRADRFSDRKGGHLDRSAAQILSRNTTRGIKMKQIKNHSTLDNRKTNLRICTQAENMRNRVPRPSKSKFKGVCWEPREQYWRGRITLNGRSESLGVFDNELEAAQAYDHRAKQLFGEFAYLNFPNTALLPE